MAHAIRIHRKPLIRPVSAVLAFGLLAGCSYVPDALNPVEWYHDTVDLFTDSDVEQADSGLSADPDAPAPDTASAPASAVSSSGSGSLAGDTTNRAYTDEVQAGQGAAVAPLGASGVAEAPAPPAMPTAPVVAAPPPMPTPSQPTFTASAPLTSAPMPPAMQESFDSALTARLPAQGSDATSLAALPSNAALPGFGGDYGTVVISSSGIDTAAPQMATVPAMTQPAMPSPGALNGPVFDIGLAGSQPMPQSGTVKVATILFENGSASLNARDVGILREVRAIHENRGGIIRIVGHASSRTRDMDPVTHKMVNFKVSVDRADTVAKALVKLGTPSDRVVVNAVSDAAPLYYEVMPSGEAGNRRTEIFISY